jgi:glycosyltransferase involved in cell wall biosynthesis
MKIIFDLRKVGLGNNGGSSTLVKSGNMLVDMGHEVFFIDNMNNQHSWTPLKAEHIRINRESQIPDADVIIATGYKSVGPTAKAPRRCGVKFHWIRAWEHWQMSETRIVKHILAAPLQKIVNSVCLQNKLKQYDVNSQIIRPGYDFGQIFPKYIREGRKDIIIGGLYREGIHGQRKRTPWLFETAWKLKTKHKNLKFWLFGSEKSPKRILCDHYERSPSIGLKNEFYNNVNIWMAPSMSEGLHLPPAEAMMTECPVVATDAELSGTQDYMVHGSTGLVAHNNLPAFINAVDVLIKDKKLRREMGINASQKITTLGGRQKNMQKMISLFEIILRIAKNEGI